MCNEDPIEHVFLRAINFQVGTITDTVEHWCSKE